MSDLPGEVRVDTDGVQHVGDQYLERATLYDGFVSRLDGIQSQYAPAWGNDNIGQQFQGPFNQTIQTVKDLIGNVQDYVKFAGQGWQAAGKAYEKADDDAGQAGRALLEAFTPKGGNNDDGSGQTLDRLTVQGKPEQSGVRRVAEPAPLGKETMFSKSVRPGQTDGDGPPAAKRMEALKPEYGTEPLDPKGKTLRLETTGPGQSTPGEKLVAGRTETKLAPLQPAEQGRSVAAPFAPAALAPASPAISALADIPGASIDGTPVPNGYELQRLTTFPDGSCRVDANFYNSITPLAGHTVTGANGQPIGGDGQYFLVQTKPNPVDASAPGYQPMIISFAPDGTATPLTG